MLLYCIITWLIGIGIGYSFEQQDKKSGKRYKIPSVFRIIAFAITMPILLPIGLGALLGDMVEDKE